MTAEQQTIFVSYASPDRDRVAPYADWLEDRGFSVWIDYERLKAGQHWDFEIRRELGKAAIVVVFVSNNSVDRRGYAQREIKLALDKADEKLPGDIYIIPVLLDDDTPIPDQIKQLHCVRASEANHFASIEDAINHQLQVKDTEVQAVQDRTRLRWSQTTHREIWEGLPGYQVEFNLMQFSSAEYPQVGDITAYLRGQLIGLVMQQRSVKFEQQPEHLSFGKGKFYRTNTFDAHCSSPVVVGNVVTIPYNIYAYSLGAHGYGYLKTFAFFLDPVVQIGSLKEMFAFDNQDAAFKIIQEAAREQLRASLMPEESGEDHADFDKEWIENGTKDWDSFTAFVLQKKEIEIHFPQYQVACYAAGPQNAAIPYERLISLMRKEYIDGLGIEGLLWAASKDRVPVQSVSPAAAPTQAAK